MRLNSLPLVLLLIAPLGCATGKNTAPDDPMFSPRSMRIHPIFTQIEDWSGDGKSNGIEALIEFQDQFGDPCKAAGTVVFELYAYRPYHPDPRGARLVEPFIGSLNTVDDQLKRWNRTSRTYQFRLAYPDIRPARSYVLTASFDHGVGRFFDEVVIEDDKGTRPVPQEPSRDAASTQSASQ